MERHARRDDLIPKATKLPVHLWLAVGALAAAAWFLWSGPARPKTGPLPPLALVADDGRPVPMAWFKEGPTVIYLWLPGDARGDAQAGELEALRRSWEGRGVRFLGVSVSASPTAGRMSASTLGLGFQVVTAKGNVLEALGVRGFSATLLVNAHAQVVDRVEGIRGPAELGPAIERVVQR